MSRLEQQIQFILEIDKVKQIFRQNYLADGERKENDAEHSWHIALMAYLLQEYVQEPVDVMRVTMMVLIHDLVEIDAGDTYAYDTEGAKTKDEREQKAATRIFGLLPTEQGAHFRELWDEFEAYQTADARYAHLLDNFQPMLLNSASGGKSWEEHQVRKAWMYQRNERVTEIAPEIWQYMQNIIERNIREGHIKEE